MLLSLITGLKTYKEAISLINKHRLWGSLLLPGIIALLIFIIVFGVVLFISDDIGSWLTQYYPFEKGERVMEVLTTFLSGLLIIVVTLFILKYLIVILAGPLMSELSVKVEAILTQKPVSQSIGWVRGIQRGIRMSIKLFTGELVRVAPLSVLSMIPALGLFTPILIFIVQSYYAGLGTLDFALERRYDVKDAIQFGKKHRWQTIGIGIPYLLLFFIPVLGVCLAPGLSTVAATIASCKAHENDNPE
jgi:CysZ protein